MQIKNVLSILATFVSSVSMQYIVSIAKFGHNWSIWQNHLFDYPYYPTFGTCPISNLDDFFGNYPNRPWPPLFLLPGKLYRKFSNISNKYSILEWENVPYLTCHVMYLLTQNVWPWQDLNLHRSRRDSNPQCLDPSSNALSYATRLLYWLSYMAGSNLMYKDTAWSRMLRLML